jgi:hypothetical protein
MIISYFAAWFLKCRISILTIFQESQKTSFLRNHFDGRLKFESLSAIVFRFIQNIKLLHIHIHEQNFILLWIYYTVKVSHN